MDGTSLVHAVKNHTNFGNCFLGKALIAHSLCALVQYTSKRTLANVLKDAEEVGLVLKAVNYMC